MRTTTPTATYSPPADDDLSPGLLVLRDGSVVTVLPSRPDDQVAIRQFFAGLSPESRRNRFLGMAEPPAALVADLARSDDPARAFTLIARREVHGATRVVAVASYLALTRRAADVAFAVADGFAGKGITTLLLEQLAATAQREGFETFHASMLSSNASMREVFRDSGFAIRSMPSGDAIDLQLTLAASAEGVLAAERRRRDAVAHSIQPLLAPASVAVIGASRDPHKLGGRVLRAMIAAGFTGPIYPINPLAAEIGGLPALATARALPPGVELAVIAVPPSHVLAAVDDCGAAGVKAVLVVTAGFAEAGPDGRALQDTLCQRVRGYGMRMVGPNCMGLLNTNPALRLNASFSPIFPPAGRVALSSQSGALGITILRLAAERGVGLSSFVSVGNKADVSGNDLLEYWESDPQTGVIMLYLESFGNPRRFARLARRVGRSKPIIALKAGRSAVGAKAAGSHTAAVATLDAAVDAVFHQTGVIRAGTIDEMFDIAACLDLQPLPAGGRVAIVTNAGGPGILAADACAGAGLTVVPLSDATCASLREFLPATASVGNPIDMVASAGPEDYRRAIETVLGAPEIDSLIVVYTPIDEEAAAAPIHQAIRDGIAAGRRAGAVAKPIVACLMSDAARLPMPVGSEQVPTYAFPENAARALGKAACYAAWKRQPAGLTWAFDDLRVQTAREICRRAIARGGTWLDADDTWAVLDAFGLPTVVHRLAHTPEEAATLATAIGFPVAAKVAVSAIIHKSDIGGVRLNLGSVADVRQAAAELLECARAAAPASPASPAVLIEPMVPDGVEVFIGVTHDPTFGPLVAFGLGGIAIEAIADVHFRVAPLTDRDAEELLHEIRGLPLLTGFRGRPRMDLEALREALLHVSALAENVPEVRELDLNPVMALPSGCRIVDARIKVGE